MNIALIRQKFTELFNTTPLLVRAPGRINLIGEHTDYNDGFVLPAAIDKALYFAINTNTDHVIRLYALDLDEYFETREISKKAATRSWASYFLGVLAQFRARGIEISGFDCVFGGNIPHGAGLSSSAALECGFAYGVDHLLETRFSGRELALMAQKAEHEYAGVMCGIMDQYASVFGKENHVMRLDCRTIEHEYFPFSMDRYVIALCDTQVKHQLASSEYNLRRKECERGVALIGRHDPSARALRDVSLPMLETHRGDFDPVTYKRCRYVVEENQRVMDACEALEAGDFHRFGELMYLSHEGLQHMYEVSCTELDVLVDLTRDMDDVLGARMMGGGFGGCTINLVKRANTEAFTKRIASGYKKATGKETRIYLVDINQGVGPIGT